MLSGNRAGTAGLGLDGRGGKVVGGNTGLGGVAGTANFGGAVTGRGGFADGAWPNAWPSAANQHNRMSAPPRSPPLAKVANLSDSTFIRLAQTAEEIVALFTSD